MSKQRIHLELLLGRKVRDSAGESAGRIEEVIARQQDGECRVRAYMLGREGLLERLSITGVSLLFLGLLGAHRRGKAREAPWNQMDLTDVKHPKLRCTIAELDAMQPRR